MGYINNRYDACPKVMVRSSCGDLFLGISTDDQVHICGSTIYEPVRKDGTLVMDGFEGKLFLPSVEIDVSVSVGNIWGELAAGGKIYNVVGNIILRLYSPFLLRAESVVGQVEVPPSDLSATALDLSSIVGDIKVDYKGIP
jgi:hypothetical protein